MITRCRNIIGKLFLRRRHCHDDDTHGREGRRPRGGEVGTAVLAGLALARLEALL